MSSIDSYGIFSQSAYLPLAVEFRGAGTETLPLVLAFEGNSHSALASNQIIFPLDNEFIESRKVRAFDDALRSIALILKRPETIGKERYWLGGGAFHSSSGPIPSACEPETGIFLKNTRIRSLLNPGGSSL